MAKRQHRRSISVKGITYERLRQHCGTIEASISGWLEDAIAERLDAVGAPEVTPEMANELRQVRRFERPSKGIGGIHEF